MANLSPQWEPPAKPPYNFSYSADSIMHYSVWIQLAQQQILTIDSERHGVVGDHGIDAHCMDQSPRLRIR